MEATAQRPSDHVREVSPESTNERIDREMRQNLRHYAKASPEDIRKRIAELDKEWDVERTLELNASAIAFTGVILAATVNKKWLILPGIVTAFLAQHAIQGWCPPLPVIRAFGIRTRKEIDQERYALVDILKKKK